MNLKEDIKFTKDYWELPQVVRGREIDNAINQSIPEGLGKNFPVVDRLKDRMFVSTKSMDLGLQSYQNPVRLKFTLENYMRKLEGFEGKYFGELDTYKWTSGRTISKDEYDRIVLEIIIPDVFITDEVDKVLNDFQIAGTKGKFEVWYRIGEVAK